MKTRVLAGVAAAIGLLAGSGVLAAGSVNQAFTVNLTISPNCTVDTISDLVFPAQTFLVAPVDATTSITVNCTKGTDATVALSGTAGSRQMTNGTDFIDYDLYQDASYATDWDSTSTATITGVGVDSSGVTQDSSEATGTTRTIYGLVPAQDTNTTGDYADSVTATVAF